MSDEAFARRFYSDRAELTALGVPLDSQRDEFTGEELYTLRSENYFLDRLELDDDELAALQTALYYLEGKFAYAEPLRLALQNLALGRPGFSETPTGTAERVRVSAPDYSPELAGRLSKLEAAISKQRTITFRYASPTREREGERRLNPYALRLDEGIWYVVGQDLDRDAIRTFRVSRIRSDIRFATRRERDFRLPPDFDVEAHRVPRPWQVGEPVGRARIAVQGDTAWWVHRTLSDAGTLEDGVFETDYSRLEPLVGWILRQNGRAVPLEPEELRDAVAAALAALRERHEGETPAPRARAACRHEPPARRAARRARRARALRRAPVPARAPARLVRRREERAARRRRARATVLDPTRGAAGPPLLAQPRQLRRRLLHGLRRGRRRHRHRARRQGAVRRRVPQVAQADPARGARDPTRDRVRRADDRRRGAHPARARAAQARGDVRPLRARADTRAACLRATRRQLVKHPVDRRRQASGRRDRVPQGGRGEPLRPASWSRTRSSGSCPVWRVHTWDRTVDGPRTYRLDRMRSARLTDERFEPREGFDPNYLSEPHVARVWHSPAIARWKIERGARALTDRSALSDLSFKTREWLLSEVLADRGESVVLEPARCARRRPSGHASCRRSSVSPPLAVVARQSQRERRALARAPTSARAAHRAPRRRHARRRDPRPVEPAPLTPGANGSSSGVHTGAVVRDDDPHLVPALAGASPSPDLPDAGRSRRGSRAPAAGAPGSALTTSPCLDVDLDPVAA